MELSREALSLGLTFYHPAWQQGDGPLLDGIAFNIDTRLWPDASVRHVELACKLDVNEFRGNRSVQLLIEHIWPL
ncbi:hypothetical protein COO59_16930 [Mixta theicola]|uniref:RecJ OB domain-containing protein n=1 Tax=Mixta theicola TaxID=1458355 RepID=A0A2K1Q5X2_9GAMM|nr:hypothetical protein COO59_16930 [Mixta theicola]GLR08306.1 hypothetical protein GCM10007905_10250 [Mixta theicola]